MTGQRLVSAAADELSRVVMTLVTDEPYFGHLLAGLNRSFNDVNVATLAVRVHEGRVLLGVNPSFFMDTLARHEERVAAVKHEILHLVLKHLFRTDWKSMDRQIANLAADLVVNQLIGPKWELPDGAIQLSTFTDIELPADQTFGWYYDALMANRAQIPPGLSASHSDHSAWGDFAGTEGTIAESMFVKQLGRTRRRSARGWSLLPAPLRFIVEMYIAEMQPSVDWRRVLRMFSNSSRRTRLRGTLRRPSKRYGTYPGSAVKRDHRLVVAVDTSGSIGEDDVAAFFAEITAIWRQGAEITVLECDQAVQRVSSFRGELPRDVAGRGGTAFDPVFEWVGDQPVRFDGIVYLTDGYAAEPQIRPRAPVLWVLTSDGSDASLRFGRIARIRG